VIQMKLVYLVAAIGGGGLLLIQIALSLFGADHDAGVDHDFGHDVGHDSGHESGGHGSGGLSFSFRAVVAFLAFFGIGGMAAIQGGLTTVPTLAIAVGSGVAAFWLVSFALMQFGRLRSSGNVDIRNAVGTEAKVYLAVPARGSGEGAVTVAIQGRSMQFKAISRGKELRTGALCRVTSVHSGDTLEIEPL
jgi:hypothetical protein